MNEIYWLTRIGTIGDACVAFIFIGLFALIIGAIFTPLIIDTCDDGDWWKGVFKKASKVLIILWIISLIGYFFVPTKKDMVVILGIGTTLDYIKSNDKAKQLPDKVVDSLTKYLEDTNKEDKDDNK